MPKTIRSTSDEVDANLEALRKILQPLIKQGRRKEDNGRSISCARPNGSLDREMKCGDVNFSARGTSVPDSIWGDLTCCALGRLLGTLSDILSI
jgi:hypothetical protein